MSARLLVVGVGGQGVLTAGRIVGEAALAAGLPVTVGQLHGMSQRGGSVESEVVLADGASTGSGGVDVLVALEPLEALRALPRVRAHTTVLVHRAMIVPFGVTLSGAAPPPLDAILAHLGSTARDVRAVGPSAEPGPFLLGALAGSGALPFDPAHLVAAFEAALPASRRERGGRAFTEGLLAATPSTTAHSGG